MAHGHAMPGIDDIAPVVEAMEKTHGRILLKLDTQNGSWPFIRSIMRSTRPHLWWTLVYMVITTIAAAAPALLIEQVMVRYDAIKAAPWLAEHVALLLAFPLVIYVTNVTFIRYLKAFSQAHLLQRSALMRAFAEKWFRLDPRVRHELPQGNTQNLCTSTCRLSATAWNAWWMPAWWWSISQLRAFCCGVI